MKTNDQIRDEKLQYDINREADKISAIWSGKIRIYEYLTGEEIIPSDQQQIIDQAKLTCPPLGKAFEKQITIKFNNVIKKKTYWMNCIKVLIRII